jgi:hypothetical protein
MNGERIIQDNLTYRYDGRDECEHYTLPIHEYFLKELMGLPRKLPADAVPQRLVGNVLVYVLSQADARAENPGVRRPHRVMAICPRCDSHVPAGRLFQHIGTKRCCAFIVGDAVWYTGCTTLDHGRMAAVVSEIVQSGGEDQAVYWVNLVFDYPHGGGYHHRGYSYLATGRQLHWRAERQPEGGFRPKEGQS